MTDKNIRAACDWIRTVIHDIGLETIDITDTGARGYDVDHDLLVYVTSEDQTASELELLSNLVRRDPFEAEGGAELSMAHYVRQDWSDVPVRGLVTWHASIYWRADLVDFIKMILIDDLASKR